MARGARKKSGKDDRANENVLLDDGEPPALQVHECNTQVIDRHWNHQSVRKPFWTAYFNPDEGAAVRLAGKWISLGPSRVVIIPEDTLYDCRCRGAVRHLWMIFSYPLAGETPSAWMGKLQPFEQELWHSLYKLANNTSSPHRLRHTCLAALIQEFGKKSQSSLSTGSEQLRHFHTWMKTRMATPPSLDEMAAHAGMSRRSFLRWFLAETGETPVAFQRRIRIREACRLLRFGDQSVDEIAEATGFADRHHFTRAFKAITGMGPAAFRRASPAS